MGWGAHDPGTPLRGNPPGLVDEARQRFGAYSAEQWIYGYTWPSADRTRQMGDALVDATLLRARLARWMLTERLPEWALGVVVVSELHSGVEALWHGVDEAHPLHDLPSAAPAREGLEGIYEAVDSLVDTLTTSLPDTSVLVFSMHGMGPNESDASSMVLLPELLYRRHAGEPFLHPEGSSTPPEGAWSQHLRTLFRGPAPRRRAVRKLVRRLAGRRRAGEVLERDPIRWMPASWYAKHWRHMEAFALPSYYDGRIRINLEGREAEGRVGLAAYPETCKRIEEDLLACRNPRTGRGVVREIHRSHRADPRDLGPSEADLVVVWEDESLAFEHPLYGTIGPVPARRTGGHTGGPGVALFAGADLRPGSYGTRSAFDIVPTVIEYVTGARDPGSSGESFLSEIAGP